METAKAERDLRRKSLGWGDLSRDWTRNEEGTSVWEEPGEKEDGRKIQGTGQHPTLIPA